MGRGHKSTKVPNVKLRAVPELPVEADTSVVTSRPKGKGRADSDVMEVDTKEIKPLEGKTICLSGYRDDSLRGQLLDKARELGASCNGSLLASTSFLISEPSETSEKVKAARKNNIIVLKASFIEVLYDSWSRGDYVNVNAMKDIHAAYPPPKILDGLKITITNFALDPPHIRADLQKLVKSHGGDFHLSLTKRVDVLLVGDAKPEDPIQENKKYERIVKYKREQIGEEHVPTAVWSEWLYDSIKARKPLPYENYHPERPRPTPIKLTSSSSSANQVLQDDTFIADDEQTSIPQNRTLKRSHALEIADDADEQVAAKKRNRGLDVDELLLRKSSVNATSQRKPLADTTSRNSVEPPDNGLSGLKSGHSAAALPLRPTVDRILGKSQTLPASFASSPPKPIFAGLVVSSKGLPTAFVPKVRSTVLSHGGRYCEEPDEPDVTRVVIPFANPPLEVDINDHRNVSIYWLERCLFQQEAIAHGQHWAIASHRFATPIKSAEQYKVAISGFDQCDAKLIERICGLLSVAMTVDIAEATHCIVSGEGAAKARKARERGIPIVDIDWLMALVHDNPLIKAEKAVDVTRIDTNTIKNQGQALAGCVIAISAKLNVRLLSDELLSQPLPNSQNMRSRLSDIVLELGGQIGSLQDLEVTHLLHMSNRVNDSARDVKRARDAGQAICHPTWLEACHKAGVRVNESAFPHTLAAGKSLAYVTESSTALSLRARSRSRSTASASPPKLPKVQHPGPGDELDEIIMPALKAPGLLDDPAFAAAPTPPPLGSYHSPRHSLASNRFAAGQMVEVPLQDSETLMDTDRDDKDACETSTGSNLSVATAMQKSFSAPGAMGNAKNPMTTLAALLRRSKPDSSMASISSGEEEASSAKARLKERHLARKRSSAASATSGHQDPLHRRLPVALPPEQDGMDLDSDPVGGLSESLMVTWHDDTAQAARRKLQGAFSAARARSGIAEE